MFKFLLLLLLTVLGRGSEGLLRPKPKQFISGGTSSVKGQFPYQGSLQITKNNESVHVCGCAIIWANLVITSANCYKSHKNLKVFVGNENLLQGGIVRDVEEGFLPKESDGFGKLLPYDIAILKLSSPLDFNQKHFPIKAISLPPRENCGMKSTWASVAGWGRQIWWLNLPEDQLQFNIVRIMKTETCMEILKNHVKSTDAFEGKVICSGTLNLTYSVCEGDSGSPLSQDDLLIGVVSSPLEPCGVTDLPSIYTFTCPYIDWIHEMIDLHGVKEVFTIFTKGSSSKSTI